MAKELKAELDTGTLFLEMLFLLFLGLKLGNVIDWSWWWIFAPLWIPVVLVVGIVGILFLVALISAQNKVRKDKK